MAKVVFEKLINFATAPKPAIGYLIGYDLDGILKQKDKFGVVTPIGASAVSISPTQPLDVVLSVGNDSGVNNIIMGTATNISSSNGSGKLELDLSSDVVLLSNDNSHVLLDIATASISNTNGSTSSTLNLSSGITDLSVGTVNYYSKLEQDIENFTLNFTNNSLSGVKSINVIESGENFLGGLDNKTYLHLNTSNSVTTGNVKNSVIIGGDGLTASNDDTAYVKNLETQGGLSKYSIEPSTLVGFDDLTMVTSGYLDSATSSIYTYINSLGFDSDITAVNSGAGLTGGGTAGSLTLDVNVDNGLSISNDNVVLGGTLSQNTTIDGNSTNSLSINNLTTFGVSTDSDLILSSSAGSLTLGTSSNTFEDLSGNGYGLQYTADYSSTFQNNSLITKAYVDSLGITTEITAVNSGAGLTGGGTAGSLTLDVNVDNGLSILNDNVVLGGTLSNPTLIAGNSQAITFGSVGSELSNFNINSIQGSENYTAPGSGVLNIQKNPGGINAEIDSTSTGNGKSIFDFNGGAIQLKADEDNTGNGYFSQQFAAASMGSGVAIQQSGYGLTYSQVITNADNMLVEQTVTGTSSTSGLKLNRTTGYKFEDARGGTATAGLEYSVDYSAGYTDLSLITKGDVKTGNILYVDNVYGDDATGEKGSFVNKYATIGAAELAASSGDTIIIMTMQGNESGLGEDGLTYHFLPGAGIKHTLDYTEKIFDDRGKTSNGANPLFFKITGDGEFTSVTDRNNTWGSTIYLYEGSTCEFEMRSSTIVEYLTGNKTDTGFHFWAQAEYINGAGAGKLCILKGKVKQDVIGGHYFLGAHSAIANIDVGGNVDVSAIFVQAEGCQLIDINVDQKITLGYAPTHTFKYFLNADRVPFFTGNVDTISGTSTINIKAKSVEWQNDGSNQNGLWGIFKIYEWNDNTNTHTKCYINVSVDEFLVKAGTQTVHRPFIVSSDMGNDTETVVTFDKCKITIEDGFPFTGISGSSQKDKYDIIFQDCSIDYQGVTFSSGYTIFDTSYAMPHFNNTRVKVADTSYEVVGSTVDTEIAVYGGGLFTNGVVPDDIVNINTELPMSADTTNVFSGITNIKII